MFLWSEGEQETKAEGGEGASGVRFFFMRKRRDVSRTDPHSVMQQSHLPSSLSPPHSFCLSAYPPCCSFRSSPSLFLALLLPPFTSLWFVFPPNSPVFLFPFLSMLFLSVCVRVCKPARCLSLSLSDVQQLLEGSFFLPYTSARAYTHTCAHTHPLHKI